MQSLRSHCDWDLANTGPYCCQSKPARMCRSWKDFGSMHIQPWFQRLNRLSSLSSAVSQTDETVSPLWWIVQRSNLGQISWFAECSVSYFRSSVNIFQTQLPPIPIPISLQLKSEFTWNYLACLSLFILILLVSTPHLSCFFFYIKKNLSGPGLGFRWTAWFESWSSRSGPSSMVSWAPSWAGTPWKIDVRPGYAAVEMGVWVQTKRHVFLKNKGKHAIT